MYYSYSREHAFKEVGETRQLFIDDDVIASVQNITRRRHSPRKHPANPLIRRDQSWEDTPYFRTSGFDVIRDPADGLFKCWYEDVQNYFAIRPGIGLTDARVCYAQSAGRRALGEAAARHPRHRRHGHQRRARPVAAGARPDADRHPGPDRGRPVAAFQDAARPIRAARPPAGRAAGRRALVSGAEPVRRRPLHAGVLRTACAGSPIRPTRSSPTGPATCRSSPTTRSTGSTCCTAGPASGLLRLAPGFAGGRHADVAGQARRRMEHAPVRVSPGERRPA